MRIMLKLSAEFTVYSIVVATLLFKGSRLELVLGRIFRERREVSLASSPSLSFCQGDIVHGF